MSDKAVVPYLLEAGAEVAIITRGAEGSLVFTSTSKYVIPALSGQVLDVTGGGDSFMAGFLVEWMRSGDAWKAEVLGAAVAVCVIEKTGGVERNRMPAESAVRARIPAELQPQFVQP